MNINIKGSAYIFAHVDTETHTIRSVRVMSDSNPTRFSSKETYLLLKKVQHGTSFSEAAGKARELLMPGGELHGLYDLWDGRKAHMEREAFGEELRALLRRPYDPRH